MGGPVALTDTGTTPAAEPSVVRRSGRLLLVILARTYLGVLVGLLLAAVVPVSFGWHAVVIESGSMRPAIDPGDILVAQGVDPAALQAGQVVLVDDPARPGQLISHRLAGRDPAGRLLLRGDANAVPDSTPVDPQRVQGVARLLVPWVGLPRWWAGQGQFGPLAAWLAVTVAAMALVAADTLGRLRRAGRRASRRVAAGAGVALLVVCLGVPTVRDAHAGFTAATRNPGNTVAAGTVVLGDNDADSVLFSLSGLRGNDSSTRCIKVTSSGSLASQVRLYGTTGGSGLDAYLGLTVTRGSYVPSEPAFGSCTNFVADAGTYLAGQPPGVIYTGTLQAFPDGYAAGIADPTSASPEDWTTGESHVYRFELAVADNDAAAGRTATQTFTWEAHNGTGYKSIVLSDPTLVGYWRLGETAGTTAADLKATHHGTYTAGVQLGQAGALTGDTDKAAAFDGVDDQVSVPDANSLDLSKVSIEAWVKPDVVSSGRYVLSKGGGAYYLYILDGDVVFGIHGGSTGYEFARTSGGVTAGSWYHLVGTDDGSTLRIYVNGVLRATASRSGTVIVNALALQIGALGTGGFFDGTIDEVALYNDALTMEQVQQHHRIGTGG